MVVASIALFVALSGGTYAAIKIPRNSVGAQQLKKSAVTSAKVRDRSLLAKDFRAGQLPAGPKGSDGATGLRGPAGAVGTNGADGARGATGPIGPAEFAQFYALMPPDNPATVPPGAAVDFPRLGPQSGDSIFRVDADTFRLGKPGTYRVSFQVPVNEAGQLLVELNGSELGYTVVGRANNSSQIVGDALVETTVANSVFDIVNPVGNSGSLTITPLAGGSRAVSASLVVQRLE